MNQTPPPIPPQQLDYGAPPSYKARPITSIRQTVVLLFVTIILMAELIVIAPRMANVFADFKVELPALTNLTLSASQFLRTNVLSWGLFIAIPLFVPMITTQLTYRAHLTPAEFRLRRFIFGTLVTMLLAGIAVLFAIGLILPYFSLIESLTQPGK